MAFYEWVHAQFPADATNADISRATGISESQVGRWRSQRPTIDTLQKVANKLGVPLLAPLIAAGYVTEDEAGVTSIPAPPADLSDDELAEEVRRRLVAKSDQAQEAAGYCCREGSRREREGPRPAGASARPVR